MRSSLEPIRVLLIDDDIDLMSTLAEQLKQALHAVIVKTTSVPGAISELDTRGPFDLLVSDYQIPPHTALDLTAYLEHAKTKIPFIIHSGHDRIDESKFKGSHFLGLVPKSSRGDLVQIILRYFPHAKKS